MISKLTLLLAISILSLTTRAQHQADHAAHQAQTATIEPQPLLAPAARLKEALGFLRSSFSASEKACGYQCKLVFTYDKFFTL